MAQEKPAVTNIPCRVFNATPEQREILLGKNYRNYRVEIVGRLSVATSEDESEQNLFNLEVLALPNGLLLQKVR